MPGRSKAARWARRRYASPVVAAMARRASGILVLAIVLAGCGSGSESADAATGFQLRPVDDVVPSASPGADPAELTCDVASDEAAACLSEHASESVVVPGASDTDVYVLGPVVVDAEDVADAAAQREPSGWTVLVDLTPEGSDAFASATEAAVGDRIAIVVDGRVVSAPTVQTRIGSGNRVVTGDVSEAEAQALASRLHGGAG